MERLDKTLFVAFASQKGGVGKTTFTSLVASVLHYRLGYNVAVIDCDYPQYSLVQMRERDMKMVMENDVIKKLAHRQFQTLGKKAYPVIQQKPDTALEAAEQMAADVRKDLDIVFFDLPGTVNAPGIIKALAGMDYIFTPIVADRVVMESTLVFTQLVTDVLMKQKQVAIRQIHLFWNQVDGRERNPLYEQYESIIKTLNLKVMSASVAASVRFRKENDTYSRGIFRSTLLPADEKLLQGCNLDGLINELIILLNEGNDGKG
ncbi:ParA family protein [Flavobacterium sp. MK4S-17]|uniref:ParA family protein n=1 Tax=Flavobacterium sp. MK4S-17 TaxID=2543737 RepID=UPI00135B8737|nr:ParA family protein [Flavobacterium sp. MK4S-17]